MSHTLTIHQAGGKVYKLYGLPANHHDVFRLEVAKSAASQPVHQDERLHSARQVILQYTQHDLDTHVVCLMQVFVWRTMLVPAAALHLVVMHCELAAAGGFCNALVNAAHEQIAQVCPP